MQKQITNLILLPGMDGTGDLFTPFIAAMREFNTTLTIHIIVVSYPSNTPLNYEQLTELASTYIPPNQPYILIGESFSGPIAILLAAKADGQLKGVILSCTFARNPRLHLASFNFMLPTLPINRVTMLVANQFLMANFRDETIKKMAFLAIKKISPAVMRARLNAVISVDYTKYVQKINVPILYLQAKKDYLVPASAAKNIVEQAKNVELVVINAPHLLLQIAPIEAAKHVQKHIENCLTNTT